MLGGLLAGWWGERLQLSAMGQMALPHLGVNRRIPVDPACRQVSPTGPRSDFKVHTGVYCASLPHARFYITTTPITPRHLSATALYYGN